MFNVLKGIKFPSQDNNPVTESEFKTNDDLIGEKVREELKKIDKEKRYKYYEDEKFTQLDNKDKHSYNGFFFNIMLGCMQSCAKSKKGFHGEYSTLSDINTTIKKGMSDASLHIKYEYGVDAVFSINSYDLINKGNEYTLTIEVSSESNIDPNRFSVKSTCTTTCVLDDKQRSNILEIKKLGAINTYLNRYLKQNFFNLNSDESSDFDFREKMSNTRNRNNSYVNNNDDFDDTDGF